MQAYCDLLDSPGVVFESLKQAEKIKNAAENKHLKFQITLGQDVD